MKVEYIQHCGSDLSVVNAARVSFGKFKENFDASDERLIAYLAKHNHWSPFSHNSVSLRLTAPIFIARQLQKHQVGLAWNEVSRRYVDEEPTFFVPETWRSRPEGSIKQGSADNAVRQMLFHGTVESWTGEVDSFYHNLLEASLCTYNSMIKAGICPEQARMILPQSMMTEWIWTGSLYAFARVCNLRLDPHAQIECQQIAQQISDIVQPLFPVSWKVLVS